MEAGVEPVKITIKYVGTCEPGDYQYLQVFSVILRECLSFLRLQLIRRNYYDPAAKVFLYATIRLRFFIFAIIRNFFKYFRSKCPNID